MGFSDSSEIIRDEQPLLESFIPERLFHRDGQIDTIKSCLMPIFKNKSPRSLFLHGPTGVGKTSVVQWIFEKLEETTSNASTAYINCWRHNSANAVLGKIATSMNIPFFSVKKTNAELIDGIVKYLEKTKKKLVIALDEIDRLNDKDILYDLARNNLGIVCISNDKFALMNLDARIKSSLNLEEIEFPKYSNSEIEDIIKDRINYALAPGTIDPVSIKIAANSSDGDSRVALQMIHKAAQMAESSDSKKVTKDHIVKARKSALKSKVEMILSDQSQELKILYSLVEAAENGKIKSPDLWEKFKPSCKKEISERTYRNYMEKLVSLKLIKESGEARWREYEIA